mmetsp:Transcript_41620/g.94048  ORF Transcript_41620/g.94048 Transcript_41620/m.94048 type:complete len:201 (-) Transcript_41620:580-1182(-)
MWPSSGQTDQQVSVLSSPAARSRLTRPMTKAHSSRLRGPRRRQLPRRRLTSRRSKPSTRRQSPKRRWPQRRASQQRQLRPRRLPRRPRRGHRRRGALSRRSAMGRPPPSGVRRRAPSIWARRRAERRAAVGSVLIDRVPIGIHPARTGRAWENVRRTGRTWVRSARRAAAGASSAPRTVNRPRRRTCSESCPPRVSQEAR